MAKAARFGVGSSGSGKHTETKGNGGQLGGRAPSDPMPRIGPGYEGRFKSEMSKTGGGNGGPAVKNMKRYSEE
jgi:hypothetical protein